MQDSGAERRGPTELRPLYTARADAESVWYWRLRARVIRYMATRYPAKRSTAGAPTDSPAPPKQPIPFRLDPAVVKEIRSHVRQIASANSEVDKTPPPIELPLRYTPLLWPRPGSKRWPEGRRWLIIWLPLLVVASAGYVLALASPPWLEGYMTLRFALAAASAIVVAVLMLTPLVLVVERAWDRSHGSGSRTSDRRCD